MLAQPPATDTTSGSGWFRQLRRVRIHDAAVTVIDRPLDTTWQAPHADITLTRRSQGGIDGTLDVSLALGDQRARLTGTATISPDAVGTHLIARISPVEPAELARALPRIGFLAAMDAPVAVEAVGDFGPTLDLRQAQVTLQAGAGTLRIATGSMPIVDASVIASGTPDIIRVDTAKVRFRPRPNAVPTNLAATGAIRRESGQIDADLVLDLDQVAFSDLPMLWPAGVARNTRAWILQNITAGVAQDGHCRIGLEANADLSGVTLTRASGSLEGSGLTVSWLRPVPPIVQGNAMLHVVGPDSLQIDVTSGRQCLTKGALSVTGGSMRITGLMQRDQVADIQLSTAGSLPDVIALLREPRLQLLARHPISLNNPAGNVNATVAATVPLDARVRIDDIDLHVAAHIDHAALAGLLVGRNLSDGALDIAADNDGLTVKGNARLGGIPAALDVAMDFRAGPPTQVLQRATINGRPDAKQLTAAGLDVTDFLSGPIGLQAVLTEQRDGTGGVAVNAPQCCHADRGTTGLAPATGYGGKRDGAGPAAA